LDYTKGIPNQPQAIEALLEVHPELKGQFVYLCVVVPSRERVELYGRLRREIDELVGRINSRFGTIGWMPIQYVYRRLDQDELNALYGLANVALVTPLRDGMNLVAKEYVAVHRDGFGVLILSEMAGAAKEMLEALIVSPNDKDEIARALHMALTMPEAEQVRRNMIMRARLRRADVDAWVRRFLESLDDAVESSRQLTTTLMTSGTKAKIRRQYLSSKKRLFLVDYDGTLIPFSPKPSKAKPPPEVLKLLGSLSSSERNEVFLVSGRRREDLDEWFGDASFSLVAEHGAWLKPSESGKWEALAAIDQRWKKRIRPVLELFLDRIPGSSIEEKDFSLAWHYRGSDIELGPLAAKELIDALTHLMANLDIFVMAGNKVVEVKSTHVNKGLFYNRRLASKPWDFTFAVGDDETDEYLFEVLPENSVSVKVGLSASAAKYSLENPSDVVDLMESLSASRRGRS
jgi:trehalose 6-phosphate synthase/phosphatase